MKLFYFAFCVIVATSAGSSDDDDGEEVHRRLIIDRLKNPRTSLMDGYHLVTRQVATDVHMFRSYRTVSVLFYPILRDVSVAHFTFRAEELHLNNFGSCQSQDVIIHLKYGSYPAVNPDGYNFPKNFMDPLEREKVYTIEFQSDASTTNFTIENPKPGNWYALVYLKWEDPRTQKVEQQGLAPVCQTILYTDLQIKRRDDIDLIDCYTHFTLDYDTVPSIFKCIALDDTDPITLSLSVENLPSNSTKLAVAVQALSLPTDYSNLVTCAFAPSANHTQSITFDPHPNTWHYIRVEAVSSDFTGAADCESYHLKAEDDEAENKSLATLMRDDKGRFFTFDYGFPSSDVQDSTSLVNLTSGGVTILKFKVNQILDIGGTLAIEASLLMNMKYYMGYRRPLLPKTNLLGFTENDQYFKVVICADIGHSSTPLESGFCKFNDQIKPALFVLNSTDSESIYEKTIVPFPDNGDWYLSFRLFCDNAVCPCRTSENGSLYYVDGVTNRTAEVEDLSNNTRDGVTQCNSTVVLSISSSSCVEGRCGGRGSCMLNTFGGLVMSFCSCWSGYGGWDCSDATRLDSRADMLTSVLLLTTSNLLFAFSIYVALIRLYYTEAIMYMFTMVFSTFYHACDGDAQVSYCILRLSILQFGDFYCGLMSFFVTLLAMSTLGEYLKSLLQLVGAIVVALFTTWNMHSILSFLLPFAVGGTAVVASWALHYAEHKRMPFRRAYYSRYLPLGATLVAVGLVCYAFLQTEQNYKVVHSLWHMIIALSVGFLLPDARRGDSANAFVPSSSSYCRVPFKYMFRRSARNHIAED